MSANPRDDNLRWRQNRLNEFDSADEVGENAYQIERESRPSLDAKEGDPDVTASTVAEYVFCPRAALLTHEGGFSDPEEELPALALMPWYELDAIEEAYRRCTYQLFAMPVILVVATIILSLFALRTALFPLLLIALIAVWGYAAVRIGLRWWKLNRRIFAARIATDCNPDPNKLAMQSVDWWGLLRAGYEVREPPKALKDGQWSLSGKPRRILDKGSMSIPVHRVNRNAGPLLPQHIVRVMAHCHLIETQEGANSPFAIVLYGNTYKGTTVPNTRINREKFYTALEEVRELVRFADAGRSEPPAPVTGSKCSQCPHGRPEPISLEQPTMRYDEPIDPILYGKGRTLVHCACGDRFQWKPKHKRLEGFTRVE